ncbi:MAG: M23/M56 family metallopeptidase [Pseudomonadota bacterium]
MIMIVLVLACVIICSVFSYGGAWLWCRLNPDNTAWSTLWATAIIIPLISPVFGVLILYAIPIEQASTDAAWVIPVLTPVAMELQDLGRQMETHVSSVGPSMGLTVLLSLYVIGGLLQATRLVRGRDSVRKIAMQAEFLVPIGNERIFASNSAEGPFLWTPFGQPSKSRIVFPISYFEAFDETDLDKIVRHERAHMLRRDDEVGLILRIAMLFLWVSPFAHAAFGRWVQACELQCDATVLNNKSRSFRSAYAHILLKALHLTANRVRQYPAASFSTQRLRNEKMRITHIMAGTDPVIKPIRARTALSAAALSLAFFSGGGMASLANADPAGVVSSPSPSVSLGDMVSGRITAPFGKTFDPFRDGTTRVHRGIDIAAPIGTPIRAPADGTILAATDLYQDQPAYGKVIVIATTKQTQTLFSHLDDYSVTEGQRVRKGDVIGTVGNTGKSTGPHVHIETFVDGNRVNPMDVWAPID